MKKHQKLSKIRKKSSKTTANTSKTIKNRKKPSKCTENHPKPLKIVKRCVKNNQTKA